MLQFWLWMCKSLKTVFLGWSTGKSVIRQNHKYISSILSHGWLPQQPLCLRKLLVVLANNIFTSVGSEHKLILEMKPLTLKLLDFQLWIMIVTQKYNTPSLLMVLQLLENIISFSVGEPIVVNFSHSTPQHPYYKESHVSNFMLN